jgi:hypothetical protein
LTLPLIGASVLSSDRVDNDPCVGVLDFCLQVDGPLDLGTPSGKPSYAAIVPLFDVADFAGVPKTLEWLLEVRDGKRVLIMGLNLGALFFIMGKRVGDDSSVE